MFIGHFWFIFLKYVIEFFLLFLTSQVAVKNNIDVFYFSVLIPLNIFFVEDGKMGMIFKFLKILVENK